VKHGPKTFGEERENSDKKILGPEKGVVSGQYLVVSGQYLVLRTEEPGGFSGHPTIAGQ
jgi:hypothetical protein